MASSLLTTDKRWAAPARKSGMTVLGKIPKPINLPSQRLENHGLDPSVEIVPKGTLTWGSKPQPTTANAWSSPSLLSPKNDGGSSSPSYINGRPSSGGGTRPSTAGSERSLDSPSAWGPNSRPSTASGTLASHNLLTAANRPRSAETRPGSSHLSRFADSSTENVKVSIRTMDKSGHTSQAHGFTLSTGDFPTLGSEKNSESNSQRGHSSQGRPTSSSGREAAQNEHAKNLITGAGEVISSSNYQHVKKTEHAYEGGAPFPATNLPREAQQAQQYPPNLCMPPPQFDSWHAPPGHPPEGLWHRGVAPRGPYRPAGPPSSFPVEPFAYYGQFPPSSEAAATQGPGHGVYHPRHGGAYHPHMPHNSYAINQPVIPVRPVYQGPLPYDGYYGPPPATFNNANERDPPFMGNSHQPGILNQFPDQNDKFNPVQSQSRPGKHEAIPKEKLESDRVHIARRGHPRILLEHPDHSEDVREVDSKIQFAPPLLPHPDGNRTDVNMKDTRDISGERERMLVQSVPDQRNFPGTAGKSHLDDSENVHSHPNGTDDGIIRKKLKEDHSVALNQQPVIMKNLALIEKIEGLNNKARNADARNIAEPYSSKEIKEKPKIVGPKADHVTKDVSSSAVITDIAPASGKAAYVSDSSSVAQNPPKVTADGVIVVGPPESQVTEFSKDGKLGESTSCHTYRRGNSPRNSRERPAKDRSANVSGHGWKEQSTIDSLPAVDLKNAQHGQTSVENASQQSHVAVTNEMSDSLDYEAQRTKMRELAAQRAKQLHEEEEERTRQQKAKALAKLEELNRRTSAQGQKKSNDAPQEIDDVHDKQEVGVDATTEPDTSNAESFVDVSAKSLLPPNEPKNMAIPEESKSTPVSHAAGVSKDSVIPNASSSTNNTDTNMMEHVTQKRTSRSHDSSTPKHRQMGYRRRLVVSQEKISSEKSSIAVSTKDVNNVIEATADPPSADAASHEDSSTQNKKNSRHTRNKKKVDDAPVGSTSPPVVLDASISSTSPSAMLNEQNALKVLREPKIQTPGVVISSSIFPAQGTTVTVGSITFGDLSLASLNQEWQKTHEEAHSTANSCLESVQTKRSGRNQHGVQPVDKSHGNEGVMWASIKQPSKNEQSEETKLYSTAVAALAQPSRKNNDGENVTRARRAEMERYVPKPLSKELQQQNLGQTLPSESQGASIDTSAKSNLDTKSDDKEALDKSTATKAEAAAEHKKWEDKKANRGHGRPNASWRRRNTDESALVVPSPAEHADNSHEVNVVRKPLGQQQALEPNKQSEKHLKSEGNDASENNSALTQTVALPVNTTKEHGATNRQRRHHVKAPRNEGINTINKEKAGRTDVIHQMPALAMDSNLSDNRNMSRSDMKNSGAVSHPKAHWKPKSNSHPQNNAQGNSAVEGHLDSHGDRSDMEKTHGFDSTLQDGRSRNLARKDGGNGEKETNSEHGKGDMKHEDDNLKSPSHEDTEQQRHNPAPRHHGHHDRRYHRGGGMYRGRGHDAGKPSHGTNKGGTHFEYQPVGSYNKPADFQQNPRVEERTEGHSASGPVYRERSHNRGARPAGHFVRRTVVSVTTADLHRDE